MSEKTFDKLHERKDYILNKMGPRYSSKWYMMLVTEITDRYIYNPHVGYCGEGDSACKHETLTSKLVPDPECINFSCWFHDRLYDLVKLNKITFEIADTIMRYSGYYDAQKLKGFSKFKAMTTVRIYSRAVQLRTFFSGLFK